MESFRLLQTVWIYFETKPDSPLVGTRRKEKHHGDEDDTAALYSYHYVYSSFLGIKSASATFSADGMSLLTEFDSF